MVLGTCCSLLLQRVSVLVEHYFLCWNLRLHLYWCITVALIFNNLTILGILSSDQPTLGLDILYSLFSVILFHYACHSWSYYAFKVDLLFLVQGYSLVDTHKNRCACVFLVGYYFVRSFISPIQRGSYNKREMPIIFTRSEYFFLLFCNSLMVLNAYYSQNCASVMVSCQG